MNCNEDEQISAKDFTVRGNIENSSTKYATLEKVKKKICVANITLISANIVLVEFRVFSVGYLEKQTDIFKREVAILCNVIFIDMFVTSLRKSRWKGYVHQRLIMV